MGNMFLTPCMQRLLIKMFKDGSVMRADQKIYQTEHAFYKAMRPLKDLGLVSIKKDGPANKYSLTMIDGKLFAQYLVALYDEY